MASGTLQPDVSTPGVRAGRSSDHLHRGPRPGRQLHDRARHLRPHRRRHQRLHQVPHHGSRRSLGKRLIRTFGQPVAQKDDAG